MTEHDFTFLTDEQCAMAMLYALEDDDHETAFECAAELRRRGVITDEMIAQAKRHNKRLH